MKKREKIRTNPITISVIQHRLSTIAWEMGNVIKRTAQWYILAEAEDFCTAIYNSEASLLSQATHLGLPIHIGGNSFMIKACMETHRGRIYPGDVYLVNDPYYMHAGAHLPDWTFVCPLFYKDELVLFLMCRGHQNDTGGAYPTGYFPGAYDIHAEGLKFPAIKIYEKGKLCEEIYRLILNNVRWSEGVHIDISAMVASLKLGEKRIIEVLDKYGKGLFLACLKNTLESTETSMRAEIEKMPDGVYKGESAADSDGKQEEMVWVRCAITIRGDRMEVDYSESDKQVTFINSPLPVTYAATYIAIFCAVDSNIIHNEGSYRPIEIIAPEGLCINPKYPTTVGSCSAILGQQIISAVQNALGKVIPQQVSAQWGSHFVPGIFGVDSRTNEKFFYYIMGGDGGSGAIWGCDGWPLIAPNVGRGRMIKDNVEMLETRFPFHVIKSEFRVDSAGPGKYRSGLGVINQTLNEGIDCYVHTGALDGQVALSYGSYGGKPGVLNDVYIIRNGKKIPLKTKAQYRILTGDILCTESSGGGGVGNPFERDVEKVKHDVLMGYVSVRSAREDYGVVIDPETFEIDYEKTEKIRISK